MVDDELSFDEAKGKVELARSAATKVTALLRLGENLVAGRKRWKDMSHDWRYNHRFHLEMTSLNLLLGREFRNEKERLLSVVQAP